MAALPDPEARLCVSADEAFAHLDIDRTTGYRAIRDGTFPLPVIRVGRVIRVPTAALRRLLLGDDLDTPSEEEYVSRTDPVSDPPRKAHTESATARPPVAPRLEGMARRQNRGRQVDHPGAA